MLHFLRLLVLLLGLWLAPLPPLYAATDATPDTPTTSALVNNGLLDQTFAGIRAWAGSLSTEVRKVAGGVSDLRQVQQQWSDLMDEPARRQAFFRGAGLLLLVLAAALVVEAVVRGLLRRPRRALAQRAAQAAEATHAREAQREADLAAAAAQLAQLNADTGAHDPGLLVQVDAGMVPPPTAGAGLSPEAPSDTSSGRLFLRRRRSLRHWSLLIRAPYALAYSLLQLLPLLGFIATVAVLLAPLDETFLRALAQPIVTAYVTVRLVMLLLSLLARPGYPALRLLRMGDGSATLLRNHVLVIASIAAAGIALGELAFELGLGYDARALITKLASLAAHLLLIRLVWRSHEAIATVIRGDGPSQGWRAVLAEAWPFAATTAIAAFWVVWALGVANGFQRAMRFLGITALVVTVGYLVWIILIGLLDRSFERANPRVDTLLSAGTERYHVLLRYLVNTVLAVGTGVVLLQAWGLDAFAWFAPDRVGRNLASAALTIGVAVAVALIAWELLSFSLRRRIDTWTAEGDLMRAARLRTLVPIIRTCLLVIIVLVVLLTALHELGVNTAPLLAGASIFGVALGFGSQKLVQDFITGVFLLMENTMQVGDSVTAAGVSGTVEYLSIRTVRLRAGDGSVHMVPFSAVTTVTNANREFGNAAVRITLTADADLPSVYAAMRETASGLRADADFAARILGDLDIWGVDAMDGATVTVAGQIRTTDRGRWSVQREYNRRLLEAFRNRGITLANPRETTVISA